MLELILCLCLFVTQAGFPEKDLRGCKWGQLPPFTKELSLAPLFGKKCITVRSEFGANIQIMTLFGKETKEFSLQRSPKIFARLWLTFDHNLGTLPSSCPPLNFGLDPPLKVSFAKCKISACLILKTKWLRITKFEGSLSHSLEPSTYCVQYTVQSMALFDEISSLQEEIHFVPYCLF